MKKYFLVSNISVCLLFFIIPLPENKKILFMLGVQTRNLAVVEYKSTSKEQIINYGSLSIKHNLEQ